jgi:hypothetical protein
VCAWRAPQVAPPCGAGARAALLWWLCYHQFPAPSLLVVASAVGLTQPQVGLGSLGLDSRRSPPGHCCSTLHRTAAGRLATPGLLPAPSGCRQRSARIAARLFAKDRSSAPAHPAKQVPYLDWPVLLHPHCGCESPLGGPSLGPPPLRIAQDVPSKTDNIIVILSIYLSTSFHLICRIDPPQQRAPLAAPRRGSATIRSLCTV